MELHASGMILPATPSTIEKAALQLATGHLVALPTETVYGLAGDAANGEAVAAIYAQKGRPTFNPLIVHVATRAQAREVARFNDLAEQIADEFWPGSLTLVLPKNPSADISSLVTAGLSTVAIRMPTHEVPQAILHSLGRPFVAPSANRSGHISPTRAEHVQQEFGNAVMIVDAGPCTAGIESTILSLVDEEPRLLRPGPITAAALSEVFGTKIDRKRIELSDSKGVIAPGMLTSHYAPQATLRLNVAAPDPGEGFMGFGDVSGAMLNLSPDGDLIEAAANLFDFLRDLDDRYDRIAVAPIPNQGIGVAINDRLARAAAPRGDQQ